MAEGFQIEIPDLSDESTNLPPPPGISPGFLGDPGSAHPSIEEFGTPSAPVFRGAELGYHGRSGSGTSDEAGPSSYRFPPAIPPGSAGSGAAGGGGNFSFPVKKGSFASLRAAIKGQNSAAAAAAHQERLAQAQREHAAAASEAYPPVLRNPFGKSQSFGTASAGGSDTGSSRKAAGRGAPAPWTGGGYQASPPTSNQSAGSFALSQTHTKTDSFTSGHSRAGTAPVQGTERIHHTQQPSFYSEYSGGASSSAGSVAAGGMPPLPPFPNEFSAEFGARAARAADESASPDLPRSRPGHGWGPPSMDAGSLDLAPFQPPGSSTAGAASKAAPTSIRGPARAGLGALPSGIGATDPRTPAEYALNILMSRFITLAGAKVQAALEASADIEPSLIVAFGPGVDAGFESLLSSIAHVARKNAKSVMDSLFQWRATQLETAVDASVVRRSMSEASTFNSASVKEVAAHLSQRKALVCAYLLCRALVEIAKKISRDSLTESQGNIVEGSIFELLQSCNPDRFTRSSNQQACFDIISELLGELSRTRFVSIGDRFIASLEQSAKAPLSKDLEPQVDIAIRGLRHMRITTYPMEAFEEGAEFVESLARWFMTCHGYRIKSAYAETLVHLMLPVAKSASSAEMNHPMWVKAIDTIYPKAVAMASKPRYWSVAYPLVATLLVVSPEDKLLANWFSWIEAGVAKLKDRGNRSVVLNSALRLLWVYIFRCHESSSTTTKRLEAFFRIWFPPNRRTIVPVDTALGPHIAMVHFVLYKHFDYGRDLVLEFLRHSTLSGNTLSLQPEVLSRQRMTVAIRAILLWLNSYVTEQPPPFPPSADFSRYDSQSDYEGSGDELPEDFSFPKNEMRDAQAQFADLIGKIALICDHQVGDVSVFDDRTLVLRGTTSSTLASDRALLDREGYVWRVHPSSSFTVAYNREHQPYFELLRACLESWPRCLSSSIQFSSVLAVLYRAHFSADPHVADASAETLKRIARQRKGGAASVVSGFMRWIFRLETVFWEIHHSQRLLLPKVEQSVKLWIESLNIWLNELRESQAPANGSMSESSSGQAGAKGFEMERTSAWAIIDEIEAHGLFLLCSAWCPLRRHAINILRLVAVLDDAFLSPGRKQSLAAARAAGEEEEPSRIIHLLDMPCGHFCDDGDQQLTPTQKARIKRWRRPDSAEPLSELAESDHSVEHSLWQHVLPNFLMMCLDHFPTTVAVFRSYVTNRVLSMDHAVALAAGTIPRVPTNTLGTMGKAQNGSPTMTADQILMAEHWKLYIVALCTTTTSTENSRGGSIAGHRRQSSDLGSGERVIAARDLFQKLVPFLASDQSRFRDAVVSALGNINGNLYRTLLETVQAVSSQLNEDFRTRQITRSGHKRSRRHERLRTAVAHVVQLTAPHMVKKEMLSDQSIVLIVLTWVKETFNFLTDREIRTDWEFHRLRRLFCGVVEVFYNGLADLDDTERYFTFDTRLRMFRLFRDWHSYSQTSEEGPAKLANMLASAAEQYRDEKQREQAVTLLRNETQLLSFHAGSAMAALCQGAISISGNDTSPANYVGPSLDTTSLFTWLDNLFTNSSTQNHGVARRAFKALLLHNESHDTLVRKAVDHCFSEPERATSGRSFFVVLAEVVMDKETFDLPLHQTICLALVKLGHPDMDMRRKAFTLLNTITRRHVPDLGLNDFEIGIGSPLPAIYLRAQRDISAYLASRFQAMKAAMLSEYTLRLPAIDQARRATTLGLLPEWLRDFNLLQAADQDEFPYPTYLVLSNLLFLTVKYGDGHNFEIQDIWSSLAGDSQPMNGNAIIKFLIEQALKRRSPQFVIHAKRVISCLSHTIIGPQMFDELCGFIEPASMIPVPRDEVATQFDPHLRHLYLADIDKLLPAPSRRQIFSPGQLALLFVGELTYERFEQLNVHLPVLLHAVFMQIDNFTPFVQEQMASIFEQLLRSFVSTAPGSEDESVSRSRIDQLFAKGASVFWTHDGDGTDLDQTRTPRNLKITLVETLSILEPMFPDLRVQWGNVALLWATSGPVRHLACRSFQVFRVLMPPTTPSMLADMLGRLSNTVSDPSVDIQSFALEILFTLTAVVRTTDASQKDLFSQIFWATVACLSTINEREFEVAVTMLDSLLDKLDIGSADVVEMLRVKYPEGWEGEPGSIQPLILRGLRSSVTSGVSFQVLARLAKVEDATLVDPSQSRLAFLLVAALPWFLQAVDAHTSDETVTGLATDIATLAEKSGKSDIQRIATSIAKSRFRTKDDLIRQAVGCVRVNYLPALGPELAVLQLGLILNQHEWLRRQTMQALKIFFQVVDTQSPEFSNLGSELLMPLLRLLSTPLAPQALEVLDEPLVINGGPAANQILRMSLQWGKPSRRQEQASDASIFGAPDDSGWAVAHPQDLTTRTRINIQAVFKTCELTLDVAPVSSNVNFVVDDYYDGDEVSFVNDAAETASLGDIVNQLHDLSSFFVEDNAPSNAPSFPLGAARYIHTADLAASGGFPQPSNAQVAAILSRSAFGASSASDAMSVGPATQDQGYDVTSSGNEQLYDYGQPLEASMNRLRSAESLYTLSAGRPSEDDGYDAESSLPFELDPGGESTSGVLDATQLEASVPLTVSKPPSGPPGGRGWGRRSLFKKSSKTLLLGGSHARVDSVTSTTPSNIRHQGS